MLKLSDLKKEGDYYYSLKPAKIIGKEYGEEALDIEVEDDDLKMESEVEGLGKYIDWLNSEECMKQLAEAAEDFGIDFSEWYAEIEIDYASIIIHGEGDYSASIITGDGTSIEFEGEDVYIEDEMSME